MQIQLQVLLLWPVILTSNVFKQEVLEKLTLSENCGLGIPAAKDLNIGVTWRGELNSVLDEVEAIPSLLFCSSQDGNTSATGRNILFAHYDPGQH